MAYEIEGRLLEVCTCNVLCPCWVGEDPDDKTCDTVARLGHRQGDDRGRRCRGADDRRVRPHPRNILIAAVLEGRDLRRRPSDGRAGRRAAQAVHRPARRRRSPTSQALIGEVVAVERAPITFSVEGGKGRLAIGELVDADMAPFVGATGEQTMLSETVFSTIPGSPVYAARRAGTPATARATGIPERRPEGQQRPPGPLPLRGLTGDRRCSPRPPPRSAARPARPGRGARRPVARRVVAPLSPGRRRRRALPAPRRAGSGAAAGRGRAVHRRLGADDPRDDAAVEHPAGGDVRGMVRRRPDRRRAGRRAAGRLPARLGGVGLGAWVLDRAIHAAVDALPWLAAHPR